MTTNNNAVPMPNMPAIDFSAYLQQLIQVSVEEAVKGVKAQNKADFEELGKKLSAYQKDELEFSDEDCMELGRGVAYLIKQNTDPKLTQDLIDALPAVLGLYYTHSIQKMTKKMSLVRDSHISEATQGQPLQEIPDLDEKEEASEQENKAVEVNVTVNEDGDPNFSYPEPHLGDMD